MMPCIVGYDIIKMYTQQQKKTRTLEYQVQQNMMRLMIERNNKKKTLKASQIFEFNTRNVL